MIDAAKMMLNALLKLWNFEKMRLLNSCLILSIAIVGLSGCTTMSDFYEMTPKQRAVKVCANADSLKNQAASCAAYDAAVAETQGNLARGYKIYQRCEYFEFIDGFDKVCHQRPGRRTVCDHHPRYRTEKRCQDIPMTFDRDEEEKQLAQARAAAETCQKQLTQSRKSCMDTVVDMPPDLAYSYFDKNTAP